MKHKRIKFLTFFICAILLIQSLALYPFAASSNPLLLVMGDSISTGYGLSDYNTSAQPRSKNSFAALLTNKLGYSLTNGAKDGQTTAGLLSAAKESQYTSVIKSADTIVICIGANDLQNVFEPIMGAVSESTLTEFMSSYKSRLNTAVDTAAANIEALVKYIKTNNSKAKIVIQTLYNPFEFFKFELADGKQANDVAREAIEQLNAKIRKTATSNKIILCDVYEAFNKNPDASWLKTSCKSRDELLSGKASFDIHPTAAGHKQIFNLIYSALGVNKALYEFTGFKVISDIKIAYGVAKEDIPLPKTVTVVTTRGEIELEVGSWDLSKYDPSKTSSQEIEITAKFKLPAYVLNDQGIDTVATAKLVVASAPSIKKIIEPAAITGITCGTALDYIGLPQKVTIIAGENNNEYQADVVWDTSGYDPTRVDAYKISIPGTITLPEGISNENELPLTVSVLLSVDPAPVKDDTTAPVTTPNKTTDPDDTSTPIDSTSNTAPIKKNKTSVGKVIFWILFIPILLFVIWIIIVRIIKEKRRKERARRRAAQMARRRQLARQQQNDINADQQYYDQSSGQYYDQSEQYYDQQPEQYYGQPSDQYYANPPRHSQSAQQYYEGENAQYQNESDPYSSGQAGQYDQYGQHGQQQSGDGSSDYPTVDKNSFYRR